MQRERLSVSIPETLDVSPNASSLARSLRSIGYSFSDAICDIIDNSITALATSVQILIEWRESRPIVLIKDNGKGMSRHELIEAMRPGTRSPAEQRSEGDLGRFGLGLKTASFSQSSKLSVTTWQNDLGCHRAEWDLNEVEKSNRWSLLLEQLPKPDNESATGTIIEWTHIDGFSEMDIKEGQKQLARMVVELEAHIGRTYHRFIEGQVTRKVGFTINNLPCNAINPFFPTKSITRPKEEIIDRGKRCYIQSYTLPHSAKCTSKEWELNSGPNGYLESQGFYLYRNNRLIVPGSWFGLAAKKESSKLCRASIDITHESDFDWQIDIKKSSATPPPSIRSRLKSLIHNLTSSSRQAQLYRSRSLSNADMVSIWKRVVKDGAIEYVVDHDHHLLRSLTEGFGEDEKNRVSELVNIIVNTLPTRAIYRDLCDDSASVAQPELELKSLIALAVDMKQYLQSMGRSEENISTILKNAEMFRLRWAEIKAFI
jgi:hypothetical protein